MKIAVMEFGTKMKKILRLWLALQRQFMSVKRQSALDKASFKSNRDELRRAVVDLIELSNRTFPEAKRFPKRLKLPTTLKALTLFIEELA